MNVMFPDLLYSSTAGTSQRLTTWGRRLFFFVRKLDGCSMPTAELLQPRVVVVVRGSLVGRSFVRSRAIRYPFVPAEARACIYQ